MLLLLLPLRRRSPTDLPAEVARTKSPVAAATERGPLPLEPALGRDPHDRHTVSVWHECIAEAARHLAAVNASTE